MTTHFDDLPPDAQQRVDAACDVFEAAWRAGERPDPEVAVAAAAPGDRPALRAALARVVAECRDHAPPPVVRLTVTAGPQAGAEFTFDHHDTVLVGRGGDANIRLPADDPYISRHHFFFEVNPPRARVVDLGSRNGLSVNGRRVETAELADGDEVRAGTTVFRVSIPPPDPATTWALTGGPGTCRADPFDPGRAGPVVPGYRLGAELGRGGMGVVYRATREADGVEVAVKTVTPAAAVTPRQMDLFLREIDVLRRLDHPNVVRFLAVGEGPDGRAFLVMELVAGPTAEQVVKERGPLPVGEAVRVALGALAGLDYAHRAGFVHRDVKPANLLLTGAAPDWHVRVADFGLARAYEASRLSGLTMQGEYGGTPAFTAPEQVTHYRDVRPAADQYAAAATLYRLLTRGYPHDLPAVPTDQLVYLTTKPPVPLLTRRPDLPPGLAAGVHRALSREPADRFPDAAAFADSLRPFA